MSNTNIALNSIPVDPTLSDLMNLFKKDIFLSLNCHHLATIQSFNAAAQTVTATINYTKTFFILDQTTGLNVPTQVNYPLLQDVPAIILGGGNANLTFPIAQGDQCVVLFNDRSIDNWFQSGQVGPVATSRYHSFADGLALVGLRSLQNPIANYDATRAVLRNGATGVGVSATQIKLYNAINGSLGMSMTLLLSALTTFMAACESSTDATLVAAATAFVAATTTAITNIEGILQ
jgi:hypothetical protein